MFVVREDPFRNRQIEDLFGISCDNLTFEAFIDLAKKIPNHHWAECCDFFPSFSGKEVDLDITVRFENFERDIRDLCERIGISIDIEHRNRTEHKKYRDYYTSYTRQKVAHMFERDVETFKYEF